MPSGIRPALVMAPLLWGCSVDDGIAVPMQELLDADLHIIAQSDSLHRIRDVELSPDGSLWVLNGQSPFLLRFRDGRTVEVWGHQGEGPDELGYPVALILEPGNARPTLFDVRKLRWGRLNERGSADWQPLGFRFERTLVELQWTSYGVVFPFYALGERVLTARYLAGLENQAGFWYSSIIAFEPGTDSAATILRFDSIARSPNVRETLGFALRLIPIPLWTVCPGVPETIVTYVPIRGQLQWLSAAGDVQRTLQVQEPVRRLSDEDLEKFAMFILDENTDGSPSPEAVEEMRRLLRRVRQEFGSQKPTFVGIQCDDQDRIWLQEFSTEHSPVGWGRDWYVFDDGGPMGMVRLPVGFLPRLVHSNWILGILEDSIGLQKVAMAALDDNWDVRVADGHLIRALFAESDPQQGR